MLKGPIVLAAVAFPRLMVSGALPSTDEGVLAYFAQIAHASLASGAGLPDTGTLGLYPILVSWVFALDVNHIVALRLVDMVVALAAAWILYDVVVAESRDRAGGAVIAAIVLFVMNQPVFIQAGFKNSMYAAYVPLFAAMRVAQHADATRDRRWIACGALAALSVMLRETFVPFLVVGAAAVLLGYGWRSCVRFALGSAAAAGIVMLAVIVARGGVQSLIAAYREAGVLYASMEPLRHTIVVNSATASAKAAWLPLGMAAAAIACVAAAMLRGRDGTQWRRFAFWLAVTLVPLIEPLSKIGFPYHFAVCLPGLAGLSALGWRVVLDRRTATIRTAVAAFLLAFAVYGLWPDFAALRDTWPSTRDTLASVTNPRWPADTVSKSNYLLAADAITRHSAPGSTLSVSGFMFALYPLTGLLPPAYDMSNLTAKVIVLEMDESAFARAVSACPADLLMTTARTDWPGGEAIERLVRGSGLYEPVAVIPVDAAKSYGAFGGTVFRRVSRTTTACNAVNR